MRSLRQITFIMLTGFAAVCLLAACAPATGSGSGAAVAGSARPASAGTGAARPGDAAGPGGAGTARFLDYQDNDGALGTTVLTGAIGDFGTAVSVTTAGTVDAEHNADLEFKLTRGSFRLDIASVDSRLVSAFRRFPPDIATCSGVVTVTGHAPVVSGSGTGAYRGIGGAFNVTITIAEVDARLHCGPSSAFLAQQVVTSGTGSVSFGGQ